MIFLNEEIKTEADFKTVCQQSGSEAIKILKWLQSDCQKQSFVNGATAEKRNELFHKHKHLESVIADISNALTPFAPDFNF
ncbi:hypothetical protein N2U02_004480 [Salmonella enterica]|nr:hypothetical protein [Salmonella enterica]